MSCPKLTDIPEIAFDFHALIEAASAIQHIEEQQSTLAFVP
jgi:hypothetical protein